MTKFWPTLECFSRRIFLILFIFFLAPSSNAKISPVYFKGVTEELLNRYYSPTLGAAAIDSGYLYNLRFYGNIERAYKKDVTPGQRDLQTMLEKMGCQSW